MRNDAAMQPRTKTQPQNVSRVSAYRLGGAQALPAFAVTTIQLNTEVFDSLAEFDNIATYAFTPKRAGYYLLIGKATISWLVNPNYLELYLYYTAGAFVRAWHQETIATGSHTLEVSTIQYLTPANTITLRAFVLAGAGATISSGRDYTSLSVHRLS